MKLYLNYAIGSDLFQAGPYDAHDADWERSDIAGYAGVSNVYPTQHRDPSRRLIHPDFSARPVNGE